jgi:surface antigen
MRNSARSKDEGEAVRVAAIAAKGLRVCFVLSAILLGGCASSGSASDASITSSLVGRFAPGAGPHDRASKSILAAMGEGLVGGAFTSPLAEGDRVRALEAEYQALEYSPAGKVVAWKGESGDPSGEVIAYQPYRVGSQDCRQYVHKVSHAGQSRSVGGTACRNEDGSWTPLG